MAENKELTGKVAIVTGAGRNIGRAIALALARAGASVVVNVRSNQIEAEGVVREIEAGGGKAVAVLGDIGDEKTAGALAEAALKRFGRIDILVNNAALRREKPIGDMSYAEWREVMNVILDGTFRCVHACLPALKKSGGSIINIGGITANCVVPGAIDTTRPASSQNPAHHLTHGTITGERGKAEDVAAMVRYLCGPGGRYVTGQTIHVSGGAYLGS
jgi:3-oxoacyl-[acyl-carrier protein] reductase